MLNLQTLKIKITPKIKTKSKIKFQHGIKDGLRMQNHAVGLHESSSTSRLTRFRILTPVTNDTIIISMKAVNSSIFSKSPTVTSRIAVQRAFLLVLWGYGASKWIETKTLAPPTKRQPMHAPSKSHPFVRGNNGGRCSEVTVLSPEVTVLSSEVTVLSSTVGYILGVAQWNFERLGIKCIHKIK